MYKSPKVISIGIVWLEYFLLFFQNHSKHIYTRFPIFVTVRRSRGHEQGHVERGGTQRERSLHGTLWPELISRLQLSLQGKGLLRVPILLLRSLLYIMPLSSSYYFFFGVSMPSPAPWSLAFVIFLRLFVSFCFSALSLGHQEREREKGWQEGRFVSLFSEDSKCFNVMSSYIDSRVRKIDNLCL